MKNILLAHKKVPRYLQWYFGGYEWQLRRIPIYYLKKSEQKPNYSIFKIIQEIKTILIVGAILHFDQNLVFINLIYDNILSELSGFWPENKNRI